MGDGKVTDPIWPWGTISCQHGRWQGHWPHMTVSKHQLSTWEMARSLTPYGFEELSAVNMGDGKVIDPIWPWVSISCQHGTWQGHWPHMALRNYQLSTWEMARSLTPYDLEELLISAVNMGNGKVIGPSWLFMNKISQCCLSCYQNQK